MSQLFKKLLGLILLVTTVGIATCQSLIKADPYPTKTPSLRVVR